MKARIVESKPGHPKWKKVKKLPPVTRTKIRKMKATVNTEETLLWVNILMKKDPLKEVKARLVEAKPGNLKRKKVEKVLPITCMNIRKRKATASMEGTVLGVTVPIKGGPVKKVKATIVEAKPGNLERRKVMKLI